MTTLAATSSDIAPGLPGVTPPTQNDAPELDTSAPSNTHLLAWTLAHSGFPNTTRIAADAPYRIADSARSATHFGLHLNRPVSPTALTAAMNTLRGKNPCTALLLLSDEPSEPAYRERLHLHTDRTVLGIHRHFPKHAAHRRRPRILGIAWRINARTRAIETPPTGVGFWRTLRAILRLVSPGTIRRTTIAPEIPDAFRSNLLASLSPQSLRALAASLGYDATRPYCFAHPQAVVADAAILRGPLFIDADAIIHPDQIHIGPGWITQKSAIFSLAAPPSPNHEYFIGPITHHRPRYDLIKRLFDFTFALAVLLITLPICLAVATIIKLYDRGPIFFTHQREGRHGRPFGCMKFRTMVRNAEAIKASLRKSSEVDGPQFKMANDPRITPIGRFLRKSNIDELPQLLNVLRGDMSIVGPRPSPYDENQLCPGWREARLSVKPGITGLWQISRSRNRGAADFQEWIFFDTQYVERRSLWLDFRILLLTIKELFGKGQ